MLKLDDGEVFGTSKLYSDIHLSLTKEVTPQDDAVTICHRGNYVI